MPSPPNRETFIIRLWRENTLPTGKEKAWRGQVQHVASGEVRAFHGLDALFLLLRDLLGKEDPTYSRPKNRLR
jgi:hypothetical protein